MKDVKIRKVLMFFVPFAVVGFILYLTSAVFTGQAPGKGEPAVEESDPMEEDSELDEEDDPDEGVDDIIDEVQEEAYDEEHVDVDA